MVQVAFEIHDVDLVAVRSDDDALVSGGPGYAFLDGDQVLLGEEAAARARLLPKRLADRFWKDLDGELLSRPWPRDLSRADLAHTHLGELWRALAKADFKSAVLVVPGSFSDRQLGFLLGIAQALEMPVDGLVDLAVAASTEAPGDRLLHLDLHLHALVVTELRRQGSDLVRQRVEIFDGFGLHALLDAWARRTGDLFIRATRFDPLHSAVSEQAVYQELAAWGQQLRESDEIDIELEANGKTYGLTLERHEWIDAAEKVYRAFDDAVRFNQQRGERLNVLLAPSLAKLPGIQAFLARREGIEIVSLARGDAARGALRALPNIRQPGAEALTFATALPSLVDKAGFDPGAVVDSGASDPFAGSESSEPPPTHLLHHGIAWPIGDGRAIFRRLITNSNGSGATLANLLESCCVVQEGGQLWFADGSSTWRINRELVVGRRALRVGDRLTHPADRSLDLHWIRVEDDELRGH